MTLDLDLKVTIPFNSIIETFATIAQIYITKTSCVELNIKDIRISVINIFLKYPEFKDIISKEFSNYLCESCLPDIMYDFIEEKTDNLTNGILDVNKINILECIEEDLNDVINETFQDTIDQRHIDCYEK